MWITPAFAQDAATTTTAAGGTSALLIQILPFLLIFVIMYFLLIRPQQRKARAHQDMIRQVRRGDTVITNGGMVGKVSKIVDDNEVEVEIAPNTRVRLIRGAIAEVRAKGEPVKEEA